MTRACAAGFLLGGLLAAAAARGDEPGARIYAERCAACHESSFVGHARPDVRLHKSAAYVYQALSYGKMRRMAEPLSRAERIAVAEYFSGKPFRPDAPREGEALSPACDAAHAAFSLALPPAFASWGSDLHNTRFVPAERAGLGAFALPSMRVAWSVALP